MVSVRALACRRCGKRQRWNPRTVWLTGTCIFLAAVFSYAGFGGNISFSRSIDLAPVKAPYARSARAASTSSATPIQVTASDLWAAYNHEAASADHRYRDKLLDVTGTVVNVPVRDFRGFIVLRLGTGDVFETVHATLARRDGAIVSGIVKGQSVTLGCVGRGALIGSPILDGCEVR